MIESLWRTRDRQLTFLLARDQVLQEVDRQCAFVRQVRLAVDREEVVALGLVENLAANSFAEILTCCGICWAWLALPSSDIVGEKFKNDRRIF